MLPSVWELTPPGSDVQDNKIDYIAHNNNAKEGQYRTHDLMGLKLAAQTDGKYHSPVEKQKKSTKRTAGISHYLLHLKKLGSGS